MNRSVISWADEQSSNLGVRVLAEGTRRLFAPAAGEADFENFTTKSAALLSTKDLWLPRWYRPRLASQWRGKYSTLIDTCGGDSFTDIYGLDRLERIALVHRAAQRAGMRVVMGPQTVGPFDSKRGQRIAARVLSSADLVFARDSASMDYISTIAPDANAYLSTDVVFALPLARPAAKRWDALINVSGLLWSENGHVDFHVYRSGVDAVITKMLDQGLRVGVLAHVLTNGTSDNDVPAVREVSAKFAGRVEEVVPVDLEDARQSVAAANMVVGSRMHACLNALSVGVPAFPWAYSRKFLPLMENLGWRHGVDLRTSDSAVEETLQFASEVSNVRGELDSVRRSAEMTLQKTRARYSA